MICGVKSLRTSLSESAASYATRALEAYVMDDLSDFVLFAGIAIEHAAKAKLARANPAFLAGRDFRSTVALSRASDDVRKLPPGTKTVGAAEALSRAAALEPSLSSHLDAAQEVIALRNGEAHLGLGDENQRRRVFVVFLRVIQGLLRVDPAKFWAPYVEVVETTLDEHVAEVDRLVKRTVAAASLAFKTRFAELGEPELGALLTVLEHQRDAEIDGEESVAIACPVCDSPAVSHGHTEQIGWDVDYDKEGNLEGGNPILTFFAGNLECRACGLELDGEEEIVAAGIDASWDNDQIDIDAWMAEAYLDDDR